MSPTPSGWKVPLSVLFIVTTHLSGTQADFSAFIQQEVRVARGAANPLGFLIQEPFTEPSEPPPGGDLPPGEPIPLRPHSALELDGGSQPWRLFPGDAPKLSKRERTGEEAYVPADPDDPVGQRCCPGDKNGYWYYNVSVPVVVPFLLGPNDTKRTDAAVLVIPGGGMRFLAWQKEGTHVAKWLNSIGINAFVLKYRIPADTDNENDESLMDIQQAMSLLRYRAADLGLNSERIGVIGFSAGGILAARASTAKKKVNKQAVDAVSIMPHLPNFAILIYAFGNPMYAKGAPPTFIAVARDDQCVNSKMAENYFFALENGKHKGHELHIFSEGRHGYGDCSMYVEGMQWKSVCEWTNLVKGYLETQIFNIHPPIAPVA